MKRKDRILRPKHSGIVYIVVKCPQEFILMANSCGYVLEHRLVMAQYIGRCLRKNELVHHIDGNTMNNDIKNLKIVRKIEHIKLHAALRREKKELIHPKRCSVCEMRSCKFNRNRRSC